MSEEKLKEEAREYVRRNRNAIIEQHASLTNVQSVANPETILMAGPPGAGKTEFTQVLLEEYAKEAHHSRYVLLDPDTIRETFEDYTGENAAVFNSAVNLAVEKILDHVYKHDQSVVIDGTLSHIGVAEKNIERALKHKRSVAIIFVHQEPELAWRFVQQREALFRRRVSRDDFILAFVNSRKNAGELKNKYQNSIDLHIVVKDDKNAVQKLHYKVQAIDSNIKSTYNVKYLKENLNDI